ncbi:MAG TPA: anti-sigma factor [Solirubrobacterales bacterium]|jgi:anti-sigma-K factor RskA|nr:anti-sigma factor [Solirubrobacterales bacterium]
MTESHERWNEDLAAYMLGALEPERAIELERHAEGCERCRAEIRWLTPALNALPESVERVEPSGELRSRLMAEVHADAGQGASARGESRAARLGMVERASSWLRDLGSGPMGLRPVAGVAVAVLVVAAVAGFAIGGGIGSGGNGGVTIPAGHAPGVTAKVVNEGDGGTLHLANVGKLPSDRVLEAWVRRDGEVEPVRALFVPDREGQASTELPDMNGVEVVMVTTEPPGGSKSPTSAPIVTIPVQ